MIKLTYHQVRSKVGGNGLSNGQIGEIWSLYKLGDVEERDLDNIEKLVLKIPNKPAIRRISLIRRLGDPKMLPKQFESGKTKEFALKVSKKTVIKQPQILLKVDRTSRTREEVEPGPYIIYKFKNNLPVKLIKNPGKSFYLDDKIRIFGNHKVKFKMEAKSITFEPKVNLIYGEKLSLFDRFYMIDENKKLHIYKQKTYYAPYIQRNVFGKRVRGRGHYIKPTISIEKMDTPKNIQSKNIIQISDDYLLDESGIIFHISYDDIKKVDTHIKFKLIKGNGIEIAGIDFNGNVWIKKYGKKFVNIDLPVKAKSISFGEYLLILDNKGAIWYFKNNKLIEIVTFYSDSDMTMSQPTASRKIKALSDIALSPIIVPYVYSRRKTHLALTDDDKLLFLYGPEHEYMIYYDSGELPGERKFIKFIDHNILTL